jgi:hypothetical protein
MLSGRALWTYVGAVVFLFLLLYLPTRSSILIGDGGHFVDVARAGDPARLHYGEPSHMLQVFLARATWLGFARIGLPVPLTGVSVGISLIGTLAAIVFFGLVAARLLQTPAAAWAGAALFGTSLHTSTQWNGELYGLALGFVIAGLFFALRGRLFLPAMLWALSVFSHSEFTLAAPAFAAAVWMARPETPDKRATVQRILVLGAVAAASCILLVLFGGWAAGKWADTPSLVAWLRQSFATRQPDMADRPEIVRALKGLFTAFSVAGHFWRDLLTGRGPGTPVFRLAAAGGLLVTALTGVMLLASMARRQVVVFALIWLIPFHVLINWWFIPTTEKYHAGALPGFVLLLVAGLVAIAARLRPHARYLLYGVYIVACAGLNYVGAVLPMHALGRDTVAAGQQIRRLVAERAGKPVFIACDDPRFLVESGAPFLRLRSVWTGSVPEIRQAIVAWTSDRLREGKEPYLVGRWCLPEEWKTSASKEPFDLLFLQQSFKLVPTGITQLPISYSVPTNPFSWTWGDVVRLEPN